MDGYTATIEIRKDERFNDLPIIAMTADAMSGVQERAKGVGMNDYITKPIDPALLFRALTKWIKPGTRLLPEEFQAQQTQRIIKPVKEDSLPHLPGVDVKNAIRRVGGSIPKYKKLLIKFIENQGDADQKIKLAMDGENNEEAIRLAHTLKGLSGTIGAKSLYEQVTSLETLLKTGKIEDAAISLADVRESLHSTLDLLRQLKTTGQAKVKKLEIDLDLLKPHMVKLKTFLEDDA